MFKKLYENSILITFLSYWSGRIMKFFGSIGFSRLFLSVEKVETAKNDSFLASVIKKTPFSRLFGKLKIIFSSLVETSLLVTFYKKALKGILSSNVRSLGVFMLSSGLYSAASYAIKLFALSDVDVYYFDVLIILFFIVLSIPMLFSKASIAKKLHSSLIAGNIIHLLGISPLSFKDKTEPKKHETAAFVLGTAFGLLSFAINPTTLIMFICLIVLVCLVLYSPESGLSLSLFLFSLIDFKYIVFITTLTLTSYVIKLARGKRNMSFRVADLAVFFFMLARVVFGNQENIARYTVIYIAYLLIINLVKNNIIFRKLVAAAGLGAFFNMILALILKLSASYSTMYPLVRTISARMDLSNNGFFLVIMLPLSISLIPAGRTVLKRFFLRINTLLVMINIILTFSLDIWFMSLGILFIYFLFKNKRPLNLLFIYGLISPVIYHLIRYAGIYNRLYHSSPLPFSAAGSGLTSMLFGSGGSASGLNLYGSFLQEGGIFLLVLFIIAIYLIITSGLGRLAKPVKQKDNALISCILTIVIYYIISGFIINPAASIQLESFLWACSGLLISANSIYYIEKGPVIERYD